MKIVEAFAIEAFTNDNHGRKYSCMSCIASTMSRTFIQAASQETPPGARTDSHSKMVGARCNCGSRVHLSCKGFQNMVSWMVMPWSPEHPEQNHAVKTFPSQLTSLQLRLEGAPVTYSGGLRDDDTGHHSFTIMARKGKVFRNQTPAVDVCSILYW